jgi:hypothetical protein
MKRNLNIHMFFCFQLSAELRIIKELGTAMASSRL